MLDKDEYPEGWAATLVFFLILVIAPLILFIGFKQSQRDYIITCTSLLPNSKPIVYHVDSYLYPSKHDPNWKFTLLSGEVIKILPYTNDIKIQEVEENSLNKGK